MALTCVVHDQEIMHADVISLTRSRFQTGPSCSFPFPEDARDHRQLIKLEKSPKSYPSTSQSSIHSFHCSCASRQSNSEFLHDLKRMSANAVATGIPHDTAKKRKGPPSANEIFTDPVPVTGDATTNGGSAPNAPKKVFVVQSNKVL